MRLPVLLRAAHPLPSLGVTVVTAGLCLLAAVPPARAAVLVLAVLIGQLSIGWHNDHLDADRDRAAGRTDKPVAAQQIQDRTVLIAALSAGLLTVGLSIPVSPLTVVVPICGWAYNAGLKATGWSALPYLVAFGSLPAVATLAADPPFLPAWWAWAAGAALGVAAHLANVLPDLGADAAAGVRGLPHRLGATGAAVGAVLLLGAGCAAIMLGSGRPTGAGAAVAWVLIAAVLTVGMTAAVRRPTGRLLFLTLLITAAAGVLLFALAGGGLR